MSITKMLMKNFTFKVINDTKILTFDYFFSSLLVGVKNHFWGNKNCSALFAKACSQNSEIRLSCMFCQVDRTKQKTKYGY